MKKILAILLCLMVALCVIVACEKDDTDNGINTSNSTNSNDKNEDNSQNDGYLSSVSKYKYDMSEYITLPDYKNHNFELKLDHLQQMIDSYIMQNATVSKRLVCMVGDVVNVAYTGFKLDENGDVLIENGEEVVFDQSNSYGVYLGAGLSIPEFESGIAGMKISQIKEVYATFPEDYFEESLRGETVMFEVVLNKIYEAPLYNNAFVSTIFPEFSNTYDFEDDLKAQLVIKDVLNFINEGAVVISYPEKEYNELVKQLEETAKNFQAQMGMTLDEYIDKNYGMTRTEYIQSEMKKEMMYYAIMQAEKLEITEQMIQNEKTALVNYYFEYYKEIGYSDSVALSNAKSVVNDLGTDYIYENVMYEETDNLLVHIVNVTEIANTYKSITQIFVERQSLEQGSEIGNLCPSDELEIFDKNGVMGTVIDPSKNVGKITVINFWGTWCGPCKSELPDFDRFASDYADDVTIYAIHSSTGYENATDYVAQNFPDSKMVFLKDYAIDPNDEYSGDSYFTQLGGTSYYPFTVIIDQNGLIVYNHVGMMSYEELVAEIEKLLPDVPEDKDEIQEDGFLEGETVFVPGYGDATIEELFDLRDNDELTEEQKEIIEQYLQALEKTIS